MPVNSTFYLGTSPPNPELQNICYDYRTDELISILHLRFKRSGRHELSDQNDALLSFARSLPGIIEADDVGMLQTLEHPGLLFEALALRLGQLTVLRTGEHKETHHPHSQKKFICNQRGRCNYLTINVSINSTAQLLRAQLQSH